MKTIRRLQEQRNGDSCGCGHDHGHDHEECGCGHDHGHDHEECGCGHDHGHDHEECGCGHDHDHHVQAETDTEGSDRGQSVYILENLGCANCAAKMERRIRELPGVESATITFATKQLRLKAKSPQRLLPEIRQICNSIESGIEIVERTAKGRSKDTYGQEAVKERGSDFRSLLEIGLGAVLFVAGEILEHMGVGSVINIAIFVIAYIILGGKVIRTAVRNLAKGQVFDENFLMSIATLGAFVIREYPEAVGVMLFYRVGEFFEEKAVAKSRSQIMDAVDMRPETVNLIQDETVQILPAEEAQIGDVLLVRPGDRIPLDGTILEGESQLDTSAITGEPVPVKVKEGDSVLSGCVNTYGQLKLRVEKELSESMVSRILDSVENAAASKPVIDRFITKFARVYTPFVVVLALATAIVPSLISGNWQHWIYTALTFLVMSCPCALVLSVPLAFFSGIGAGSKKGILFKGGISLEGLKGVHAVIMDKTGTITEGNFVLQKAVPLNGMEEQELLALAAACEQASTHPIAVSIMEAVKERRLTVEKPESLQEIAGQGILAVIGGREVLCGNKKLMEAHHIDAASYQNTEYGTEVLLAMDGVFVGYLVISDTIKSDAQASIAALKKQGLTTVMLTGDAWESARAVAEKMGIDQVHAKLLPQDKLSLLQQLRGKYGSVMFVGDGINDAPVLAGANVGAAMGSGADAAIEAADVVYMTSAMEAIPQSVQIARATSRISLQNVVFALLIKAAVMVLGLCGIASMWLAVFADTGVAFLCILNSIRILYQRL